MATKFQIKRTSVSGRTPNTADPANSSYIAAGELAVNLTDKKVFSSNGTIAFEVGANLSSIAISGAATLGNSTVNTTINSTAISVSKIFANGATGTAGQFLTSNSIGGIYWSTGSGSGGGDLTITSDTFNGNGSNTVFTLTVSSTTDKTFVYLNGVLQAPTTDYTVSGTTLTFVTAPPSDNVIEVRSFDIPSVADLTVTSDTFTANGTQTDFTLSTSDSSVTNSLVFLNGVTQVPTTDYTISGSTLSLLSAPVNNTAVHAISFTSAEIKSAEFTGNGTNTQFTLPVISSTSKTIVAINGITQTPVADYSVSGTTLIFATAPILNDKIVVKVLQSRVDSAGGNTHVQFNKSGILGGTAGFTFNETTNNVTIGNTLTVPNFILNASNPPANSTASGATGTFAWDSSYFYIAVGTNTWKKVPITTDGAGGGGSANTAGNNTEVQFNDSGVLGASAGFVFNKDSNTVTLSNTLAVGSNLTINTSAIFIGNSTVNTTIIAGNVDLQGTQLRVGNVVINGNQLVLGNITITDEAITVGNSTVNTVLGSTGNGARFTSNLQITTDDNIFTFGKVGNIASTTDSALFIVNQANTNRSAIFTEVNGQILSYGINIRQLNDPAAENPRNENVNGGIFRFDTRLGASYGDASCFVIKRQPNTANYGNTTTEFTALSVRLDTGDTYIAPQFTANVQGVDTSLVSNVMIGTTTPIAKLTVNATSYFLGSMTIANSTANTLVVASNGNVGIGNTTPINKLRVEGDAYIVTTLSANDIIANNVIRFGNGAPMQNSGALIWGGDGYGFTSEFTNSVQIRNEQGTTEQTIFLGDTTAGNAATIFGVSQGTTPILTLAGNGTLIVNTVVIGNSTTNSVLTSTSLSTGNTTITGFANILSNSTVGLQVSRSDSATQYINMRSFSSGHYIIFQSPSTNAKPAVFDVDVNGNTTADTSYLFNIDNVEKLKVNSTIVVVNNSLTTTGTANIAGNTGVGGYIIPKTLGDLYGNVYITAANNVDGNSWLRVVTQSGYVDIGAKNTSYAHFETDKTKFYFSKNIEINGYIKVYNANVVANSSGFFADQANVVVGNSTVNSVLTSTSLSTGNVTVTGDLVVSGNVFFNGSTTNLVVEDKNIIVGDVATPSDVTADGGGITLKGATDKTITWVDSTDAWTSSEDFNLVSGKSYEINGTVVVNSTSLGTGITGSSLTSVGTLTTLTAGNTTINGKLLVGNNTVNGDIVLSGTQLVSNAGKIGIGTATPAGILHIVSNTSTGTASFTEHHADFILEAGTAGNARFFLKTANNNANWEFFADDNDGAFGIYEGNTGFRAMAIVKQTGEVRFTQGTANPNNVVFAANGNVGIGTTTPGYKLEVNGSFAATTKSFVIDHPTKPGMKLRHGSLEGPENGVYVRGRATTNTIELPEYWTALVDEETITVNLTAIGKHQNLYVKSISNNVVTIGGCRDINCYYTIYGERKDVEKLEVEV